jgi:hypothetical protein
VSKRDLPNDEGKSSLAREAQWECDVRTLVGASDAWAPQLQTCCGEHTAASAPEWLARTVSNPCWEGTRPSVWRWRLWKRLRPMGRVGVFAVALGLQMLSVGGARSDDKLSIVGLIVVLAGVATALLNKRPQNEDSPSDL